jgi:hypothetical protein
MGQSKDAHDNKKKVELWESPQVINMSHTLVAYIGVLVQVENGDKLF